MDVIFAVFQPALRIPQILFSFEKKILRIRRTCKLPLYNYYKMYKGYNVFSTGTNFVQNVCTCTENVVTFNAKPYLIKCK